MKCSTPFGIIDPFTITSRADSISCCFCAQRLSASSILSLRGECRLHGTAPGAQRLSASSILSPRDGFAVSFRIVRAQRLSASSILSLQHDANQSIAFMCSTPFGIIDPFTPINERIGRRGIRVLNAFRHHRSFHCAGFGPSLLLNLAQESSRSYVLGGECCQKNKNRSILRC